jgi:hypothetical protein
MYSFDVSQKGPALSVGRSIEPNVPSSSPGATRGLAYTKLVIPPRAGIYGKGLEPGFRLSPE